MEFVTWETRCKKICVYFNAKNENDYFIKTFGLRLKCPKEVCEAGVIIIFHFNSVRCGFYYRQKCYKIVQIVV